MKIVYVGPLWYGGTCLQRMEALRQLGHQILPVDTEPEDVRRKSQRFSCRVKRKLFGPSDLANANRKILAACQQKEFDIVWIDKGITIKPETLLEVKEMYPKVKLVHYNPDDPFGAIRSGWKSFLMCAPYYDVHFVPREQNLAEYKKLGCKNVYFFYKGFNPNLHRPLSISEEERAMLGGQVGFIGSAEKERAQSIAFLAEKGIRVKVWGHKWTRWQKKLRAKFAVAGPSQYGQQYAKIINSFDINLGFLRKINRDQQTSRSIEIPACGAFMLAERTKEHLELFEEGKEAEFFGSNEELLEKVRYYLAHPQQRKQIAAAGRERCLKSGYSNQERLKQMLTIIERVENEVR